MILTEEQQKKFASDIQYEIDEFRNSIKELAKLKEAGLTQSEDGWNRTLESVLLHFRNLRDFFLGEGSHPKSDVFAKHYVSAWKAKKDGTVFKETQRRINKRIAHLTIERLEIRLDFPELDEMNAAVEKLISEFKESLSPEQVKWFLRLDKFPVQFLFGVINNCTTTEPPPKVNFIYPR